MNGVRFAVFETNLEAGEPRKDGRKIHNLEAIRPRMRATSPT